MSFKTIMDSLFASWGLLTDTGGKSDILDQVLIILVRKGVGKAMLGRVLKEAMDRDIHNVFTFIRPDNKVGLHISRKFGLLPKDQNNSGLLTEEKVLHQDF